MRILVVEDDPGITSFLRKGLGAEGYRTIEVGDTAGALAALAEGGADVDLVLLDLGLPDGDGGQVLEWLAATGRGVPVIILTARAEVADKVRGLNAGAHDYITKPFSFDELLARVRAALRTAGQPGNSELAVGDLRLDLLTKVAVRSGRRIELAPREWALLELFMRHPHHVLSRQQILDRVWDYAFDPGSNVVDVTVGHLRRKLDDPGSPPLIQTVRGAGYRLVPAG